MFWFFYNCLFAVGYTLMLPKFLFRMVRRGGYRRGFMERFTLYKPEVEASLRAGGRIWIHAVSVGELQVAASFMREWRARDPRVAFLLTTATSTGHRVAEGIVGAADMLLYFPLDFPMVMRRFLDMARPRMVALTECELWPNLIRLADARGIPVVLINGRISESSYRGYRRIRRVMRRLLPRLRLVLAQTDGDARRLRELGCRQEAVVVAGSAKFDLERPAPACGEAARQVLGVLGISPAAPLLLGGSTWEGEEAVLLDLFKRLRPAVPGLVLILVPRHAERATAVIRAVSAAGLRWARRTQMPTAGAGEPPEVLLVDTTGELLGFYAVASCVFVGKSLLHHGGQNPIEPAALGRAVVVGPHMENFPGPMEDFLAAQAVVQVRDVAGLEAALRELLLDPAKASAQGARACGVVEARRGAVVRSVDRMVPLLGPR